MNMESINLKNWCSPTKYESMCELLLPISISYAGYNLQDFPGWAFLYQRQERENIRNE